MSPSADLQKAVFDRLVADAGVAAIVGARIYDKPPADALAPYLSFGPSDAVPEDAECFLGRIEVLQIDAWSTAQDGKRECKVLTDAVKKALHKWSGSLPVDALVSVEVTSLRVFDDPDGITTHGVVTLEATIEEA